jgi:hypothetical protein
MISEIDSSASQILQRSQTQRRVQNRLLQLGAVNLGRYLPTMRRDERIQDLAGSLPQRFIRQTLQSETPQIEILNQSLVKHAPELVHRRFRLLGERVSALRQMKR